MTQGRTTERDAGAGEAGGSLDMRRRYQILEAARRRLEHYGCEKTTMAEIAAAAGLAVGTLYVYFRDKEDLLAAFGEECQEEYLRGLQRIARSSLDPAQRLRELARLRVLASKKQMEATPHGGDVLLRLMRTGHACCARRSERERRMVEQILRDGIARGEFDVTDPAQTARVFLTAFAGLMPPASLGRTKGEVEREAEALYGLLLRGLQPPRARAAAAAAHTGGHK